MYKVLKGNLSAENLCIGIVYSRFNPTITEQLLDNAVKELISLGCTKEKLSIITVPGAFEIPCVVRVMLDKKKYDAILCLGAVIKRETAHFEYVAEGIATGIAELSRNYGIPVIFYVLTTYNFEQAEERASEKGQNLGKEGAQTAVEMASLLKELRNSL